MEWAALDLFTHKRHGGLHFCFHTRTLDAATVRDSYLLPTTDKSIESLGDARVFLTLEENEGKFEVEVD